ncbi:MAG: S9 family peptidase, partial [Candidatus Methylomirabilales bacterium]
MYDLDAFLALPRVGGLSLSPDGSRLVTAVATVGPDKKRFVSALWELDPTGDAAPRRLTRSAKGESSARFTPDGAVLCTSARPDPEAGPDTPGDEDRSALWLLPAAGGEAAVVADPPAGVGGFAVARAAGTLALGVALHRSSDTLEEDGEHQKARKDAGVTAQIFDYHPIRSWDHYLGPRELRLFVADPPTGPEGRLGELRPVLDGPG